MVERVVEHVQFFPALYSEHEKPNGQSGDLRYIARIHKDSAIFRFLESEPKLAIIQSVRLKSVGFLLEVEPLPLHTDLSASAPGIQFRLGCVSSPPFALPCIFERDDAQVSTDLSWSEYVALGDYVLDSAKAQGVKTLLVGSNNSPERNFTSHGVTVDAVSRLLKWVPKRLMGKDVFLNSVFPFINFQLSKFFQRPEVSLENENPFFASHRIGSECTGCITEQRAIDYLAGTLKTSCVTEIESHLETCVRCSELLSELGASCSDQ